MSLPIGGEAKGLAGVFGTGLNPLSTYMTYASQRQRNKAAMAAQQKLERDKTMDYLDKFNPTSKFKELNYKINETAQRVVRDPVMQGLEQGQSLSQMQAKIQFNKGQVEGLVGESDQWKATIDKIQEEFDKDPIRYNQNAKSALRDIYLNDDGTVKDFFHFILFFRQLRDQNCNYECSNYFLSIGHSTHLSEILKELFWLLISYPSLL